MCRGDLRQSGDKRTVAGEMREELWRLKTIVQRAQAFQRKRGREAGCIAQHQSETARQAREVIEELCLAKSRDSTVPLPERRGCQGMHRLNLDRPNHLTDRDLRVHPDGRSNGKPHRPAAELD